MTFQDINGRYKQIKDFEDYFITEYGEVYSIRPYGKQKNPTLRKLKPKNPGKPNKYLNVLLCNDNGQVAKSIHRLVAEAFVSGYFDGAVVNHIDGNNRNNRESNLEWVSIKENVHKSYITSGKSAVRNVKIWQLIDKDGAALGSFYGHNEMEAFVKNSQIDASPTQLTKKGNSRGYTIIKSNMQTENCNDYPKGVQRR